MPRTIRYPALLLTLSLAAGLVHAKSIRTTDGQTLVGEVLEETEEYIRLKTKYGELTIPRKEIKEKPEKKKKPPKKEAPKKLDARQLLKEYQAAKTHFEKKEYAKAIEAYARILASYPENRHCLYNTACAHALLGHEKEALDFLERSVEAGFVNFDHIERDTDLDSLRGTDVYKDLLARRAELVKKAMDRAVERISESLAKRKIKAKAYRTVYDTERNFVYLHARSEEELAIIRNGLERFAEYQWKHLFQNKPGSPVYIILLTAEDSPKVLGRRAGGVFSRNANALFCGDMAAYKLTKTSVVLHEFTHALHYADQGVRRQQHPIWLVEGLSTLFESSDEKDGAFTPRHNQRLAAMQAYVKANRSLAWTTMVKLNHLTFLRGARLCYAQARYMLFYMYEKGLLKRFYDEYTDASGYEGDKTAQEAFEVVFGKPMAAVESDWKEWVLKQVVPPIPFLGVATRPDRDKLVVTEVITESGAADAGLKKGDVITAIDDSDIKTHADLLEAIGKRDTGDEVDIVLKRGKEELHVSAVLGKRPSAAEAAKARGVGYLGLTVEPREAGVFAKAVAEGSPAAAAGIAVGTQIVEFKGKPVKSVRDYLRALKACKPRETVKLKVGEPGAEPKIISVKLVEMP